MVKRSKKKKKASKDYSKFSKVDEKRDIKSLLADPKETGEKRGYEQIIRIPRIFMNKDPVRRKIKRFCKTCGIRTIFHVNRMFALVCSCCGMRSDEFKSEKKL